LSVSWALIKLVSASELCYCIEVQVLCVAIEEEDDDIPDLVEGNFEEVSED